MSPDRSESASAESAARAARIGRVLAVVVALAAAAVALHQVATLLYVFFARIAYPMDLEWCEGGTLYQAWRLLHGQPLFGQEDSVFLPFPYPPVHIGALALTAPLGLDFWTGRLVSILALGLAASVLGREVVRGLGGSLLALPAAALALGVVAVGYPVVGGWYDLVRVDSLTLCLCVLGAGLVSVERYTARRMIAASVVLAMAVYTKQTSGVFVAWIVLFVLLRDRRRGLELAGWTLLWGVLLLALLQWWTDGHFWRVIFTNLARHPTDARRYASGLGRMVAFAPFLPLLLVLLLFLGWRRLLTARSLLWSGMLACAFPVALLPFAKLGGYVNNFVPVVVLVGPVAALLLGDLARGEGRAGQFGAWAALALLTFFVWERRVEPQDHLPSQLQWRQAAELNHVVAGLEGGVLIPHLPFVASRNGHVNQQWHSMVYVDLQLAGRDFDMGRRVEQVGAEWALLDRRDGSPQAREIRRRYQRVRLLPPAARVSMVTGFPATVDELLRLRTAAGPSTPETREPRDTPAPAP